ncbi:hypothetical protein NPIL_2301 [Nephila pilipes]|uniref:Uncharacterized protein n=1 Tax=Nephila pilipes TaxID=299642 RepID=A0A8X6U8P2_NEPPI|nr:hypothetical protein NPIL_291571 [Nephila pilipes]GFU03984.1 hypothetical protein NPIL_2301 [Nephila pilipes]
MRSILPRVPHFDQTIRCIRMRGHSLQAAPLFFGTSTTSYCSSYSPILRNLSGTLYHSPRGLDMTADTKGEPLHPLQKVIVWAEDRCLWAKGPLLACFYQSLLA